MSKKSKFVSFLVIFLCISLTATGMILYSGKDYPLSMPIDPAQLWEAHRESTVLDTLVLEDEVFLLTQNPDGMQYLLRLEKHTFLPRCAMPEYWFMAEVTDTHVYLNNNHFTVTDGTLIPYADIKTVQFNATAYWLVLTVGILGATIMSWRFFCVNYQGFLNRRQPTISVRASVVGKEQNMDNVIFSGSASRFSGDVYMLVFDTDEGSRVTLTVPRDTYYSLEDGTSGVLVYQGTKCEKFTRRHE